MSETGFGLVVDGSLRLTVGLEDGVVVDLVEVVGTVVIGGLNQVRHHLCGGVGLGA